MMDSDFSRKTDELFEKAMRLEPAKREEFLRRECGEDAELYDQVTALLKGDEEADRIFGSLAADATDLMRSYDVLGKRMGRYEVRGRIGSGGMGEVYLAVDRELDRRAAIKLLPIQMAGDMKARARFAREGKAAARLTHPNIVSVYEVGDFHGAPFLAMEYIEGQPLHVYRGSGSLPVDRTVELAIPLCEGLAAAHKAGVIHRDIKPSNIMVDTNGQPRILDFGLAIFVDSDTLTRTGSTLGTVAYMSPEQIEGEHVDARTDLFSLGVVLWELLTGVNPFKRDNIAATTRAITEHRPDLHGRLDLNIPPYLQQIVLKLLEKDPAMRYQSVDEVIDDLRREMAPRFQAGRTPSLSKQPSAALRSLAVLPFTNLNEHAEEDYFSDGMADGIRDALRGVPGLHVTDNTSSLAFKGKATDIPEIGRRLDVAYIVEGSTRQAGNWMRMTCALYRVADNRSMWSKRFDLELDNIFKIQNEISAAIVEELKVKLIGEHQERLVRQPTDNIEAYNRYLQGRYHWNKRDTGNIQRAIEFFTRAAELDPKFALNYVGMADAYIVLIDMAHSLKERFCLQASAEESVLKALELDSSLGEAHAALAQIRCSQWNWREAEEGFQTATQLNPGYATVHHWYSVFLAAQGSFAQSLRHIESARELDPLSFTIVSAHAIAAYITRQHSAAIEICREGQEFNPDWPHYSMIAGWAHLETGNHIEAIEQFTQSIRIGERATPGERDPHWVMPFIGIVHARMGERGKARKVLEDTVERTRHEYIPHSRISSLYFAVDEMDRGFEWLERSVEEKEFWLPFFRLSPFFDNVRSDPRFHALVRKVGLDPDQKPVRGSEQFQALVEQGTSQRDGGSETSIHDLSWRVTSSGKTLSGKHEAKQSASAEANGYYRRGLSYHELNISHQELNLARSMYLKAIDLDPDFVSALAKLSEIYTLMAWETWVDENLAKTAKEYLDRAAALSPEATEILEATGSYYFWAKREFDRALSYYEAARESAPTHAPIHAKMGMLLRRMGRWDDAVDAFSHASTLPTEDTGVMYEWGLTVGRLHRYDEAVGIIAEALDRGPHLRWAYSDKSWLEVYRDGDTRAARDTLARAVATNQRWPGLTLCEVWLDCLERDYEAALRRLSNADQAHIWASSSEVECFLMRSDVCRYTGDFSETEKNSDNARKFLEDMLPSNPSSPWFYMYLARAYAGLGRSDDALKAIDKSIAMVPIEKDSYDGPVVRRWRATILTTLGEHERAIDEFEYLLSIPSDTAAGWHSLHPEFDPLRSYNRWRDLMAQYGHPIQ